MRSLSRLVSPAAIGFFSFSACRRCFFSAAFLAWAFYFCSAARAQISVSAAQAGSGEYVYEVAKDPNGFEQDAQDWNAAFQDLGSNVKANALISDGAAPVFYVANALPKETAMDR